MSNYGESSFSIIDVMKGDGSAPAAEKERKKPGPKKGWKKAKAEKEAEAAGTTSTSTNIERTKTPSETTTTTERKKPGPKKGWKQQRAADAAAAAAAAGEDPVAAAEAVLASLARTPSASKKEDSSKKSKTKSKSKAPAPVPAPASNPASDPASSTSSETTTPAPTAIAAATTAATMKPAAGGSKKKKKPAPAAVAASSDMDEEDDDEDMSGASTSGPKIEIEVSKTIVICMGSEQLKIGLTTQLEPVVMKNCLAMRKNTDEDESSTSPESKRPRLDQAEEEEEEDTSAREEELVKTRQKLLVKRGILKGEGDEEEEVYFEEIRQPEIVQLEDPSAAKRKWTDVSKRPKVVVGEEALLIHPNEPYEVHFPIRGGYFNYLPHPSVAKKNKCGSSKRVNKKNKSLANILDEIELILDHALTVKLNIPRKELENYAVFFTVPDMCDSFELREMLNLFFKRFRFKAAFFHQESICSAFGTALSTCCVLDVGKTKTSVAVIEEGMLLPKSRIQLPYGMADIENCFMWVLKQCNVDIKVFEFGTEGEGENKDETTAAADDNDNSSAQLAFLPPTELELADVRERYVQLHDGEEVFQRIEFFNMIKNQMVTLEVGDPLLIAVLGMFHPRLFMPYRPGSVHMPPFEDAEDCWNEHYLLETNDLKYKSFTRVEDFLPYQRQIFADNASLAKKLSVDRAIIKAIANSGLEPAANNNNNNGSGSGSSRGGRDQERIKPTLPLLLTGGGSLTRGFADYLDARLHHSAAAKNCKYQFEVINGIARDETKADARMLSYRGAVLLSQLQSAKSSIKDKYDQMWVSREEFLVQNMRIVREKAPFIF